MSLCSKPTTADYWSSNWLTKTQFGDVMPRRRFEWLSSFLHFSNNEDQAELQSAVQNPICAGYCWSLLWVCLQTWSMSVNRWKYREIQRQSFFRQYLPSKPTCESKTGYHLKHVIYTGRKTVERDEGVPFTTQLVSLLLQGYKHMGHMVFLDNFYSSPDLFLLLKDSFGIGACGTVWINQKHMRHMLQPSVLSLR